MCKRCIATFIVFLLIAVAALFLVLKDADANGSIVVINEIAWMGGTTSHYDEWIELYNSTPSDIDLNGWVLKADDDTPTIELSGSIPAEGYFLLVRTSESSSLLGSANITYGTRGTSWALKNNPDAEHLKLIDSGGSIVDEVNSLGGWFGGDNDSKQTMERVDPTVSGNNSNNWANGPTGGTPKAINSSAGPKEPEPQSEPGPEPGPEPAQESPQTNTEEQNTVNDEESVEKNSEPQFIKTNDVIISELIPWPEGADRENEWIEIHNQGNTSYNLSGWALDVTEGNSKSYVFSQNTYINPGEYRVFWITETGLLLRNAGNTLRLLYPDGDKAHDVIYPEAKNGWSYALINGNWAWTDNYTPGSTNRALSESTNKEKETSSSKQNVSEQEDTDEEESKIETTDINKLSASINQGENNTGMFVPFLLGILLSIAGGSGFWFLKKKYIK
ncbi:MAG: lamin tail domain-containing protein [Candidatus Spechtbacteria bacterium]|nr:lamin tail domain-containing protein [Candidatus Spechtbacteria bacterium]